jgi:hypothetical protein
MLGRLEPGDPVPLPTVLGRLEFPVPLPTVLGRLELAPVPLLAVLGRLEFAPVPLFVVLGRLEFASVRRSLATRRSASFPRSLALLAASWKCAMLLGIFPGSVLLFDKLMLRLLGTGGSDKLSPTVIGTLGVTGEGCI